MFRAALAFPSLGSTVKQPPCSSRGSDEMGPPPQHLEAEAEPDPGSARVPTRSDQVGLAVVAIRGAVAKCDGCGHPSPSPIDVS
jgi:hypothetical protein